MIKLIEIIILGTIVFSVAAYWVWSEYRLKEKSKIEDFRERLKETYRR